MTKKIYRINSNDYKSIDVESKTLRCVLFWSYANVAMAQYALTNGLSSYDKTSYMIRSRLYKGLSAGYMKISSLYDDEKARLKANRECVYCQSTVKLSLDHLIPKAFGGSDSADNLVYACRSCNSSKGGRDLLVWCDRRNKFPPLLVLRRYLKLLIDYCEDRDLMNIEFKNSFEFITPFNISLIPLDFPLPKQLWF